MKIYKTNEIEHLPSDNKWISVEDMIKELNNLTIPQNPLNSIGERFIDKKVRYLIKVLKKANAKGDK